MGFGNGLERNVTVVCVHAGDQLRQVPECALKPEVGNLGGVGKRCVRKRLGGSAGVRSGHVGDAIMNDVFRDVDGFLMGGRARGFRAAALVDRDVHKD